MNYITPDSEVRKAFSGLESVPGLSNLSVRGMVIYSLCRFHVEMLYRIAYFRKYNSEAKTRSTVPEKNNPTKIKRNSILKRLNQKINFHKERRKIRKYYDQFDRLENLNKTTPYLFLATSGFRDKNNFSAESWEIVSHLKLKKEPITFILPNFSTEIKRRKEYDNFFSLDLHLKEKLNGEEQGKLEDFKNIVRENLTILSDDEISTLDWYTSEVLSYSVQLRKIVTQLKPKYLIAKSVYSNSWIKGACVGTETKVVEVQHGVFTANNFYYYPLGKMSASELLLPDYVFCFGKEWLELLRRQSDIWNDKNSGNIGTSKNIKIIKTKKSKTTVLIALQDTSLGILDIRTEITDFLMRYAAELGDHEFVVRPHPADNYIAIKNNYKGISNIKLSNPQEETSMEALLKADIVISATSMLIYEALSAGIPVISFEKFRYMTLPDHIHFIETPESLYKTLKDNFPTEIKDPPEYLSGMNFGEFERVLDITSPK